MVAARRLVEAELGREFVEMPAHNLDDIYIDSSSRTPIIFVIQPGADPFIQIAQLAESKNMTEKNRFTVISLGQG